MKITPKFNFGDYVTLRTDPCTTRQISGMMIRPLSKRGVSITYGLANKDEESWHTECEIMSARSNFKVKGFKG